MSIFKGIGSAKSSKLANYIKGDCRGLFRIDCVKQGKTRKQDDFFAVEMTTVRLVSGDCHRPNESVTYMIPFFGKGVDMALPNVKAFIAGVLAIDNIDDQSEEELLAICEQVVGDDQPLAGLLVDVEAKEITTREGNPFTKVVFHGEIAPKEAVELLTAEEQKQFFPGNVLQQQAESEAAEAA